MGSTTFQRRFRGRGPDLAPAAGRQYMHLYTILWRPTPLRLQLPSRPLSLMSGLLTRSFETDPEHDAIDGGLRDLTPSRYLRAGRGWWRLPGPPDLLCRPQLCRARAGN